MLQVMAGYDASDPTSVDAPVPDYSTALTESLEGVRIGVEREHHLGHTHAEPEALAAFEASLRVLEEAGASIVDVTLPHYEEAAFADLMIMVAEAASYHMLDFRERWEDYGRNLRKTLIWGMGFSAADYVQAQRLRSFAIKEIAEVMTSVDAIVHPTALMGAPTVEMANTSSWADWPIFTGYANAVGNPALSIPMGFSMGLPVSLSIIGRPFEESTVLRVGDAYQRITDWHLQTPPIMAEVDAR